MTINKTDRNLLDKSHREILKQHNIDFIEVKGSWEQRFKKAVRKIDQLITIKLFKN